MAYRILIKFLYLVNQIILFWCSLFLALMYGCTSTAIEKVRGVEDEYNSIAAAVTTGVLFKSTGDKLGS